MIIDATRGRTRVTDRPEAGVVQEHPVPNKEPHRVRKNDLDSTCSENGFLTDWDGAA
jgi:hypothetical protein